MLARLVLALARMLSHIMRHRYKYNVLVCDLAAHAAGCYEYFLFLLFVLIQHPFHFGGTFVVEKTAERCCTIATVARVERLY